MRKIMSLTWLSLLLLTACSSDSTPPGGDKKTETEIDYIIGEDEEEEMIKKVNNLDSLTMKTKYQRIGFDGKTKELYINSAEILREDDHYYVHCSINGKHELFLYEEGNYYYWYTSGKEYQFGNEIGEGSVISAINEHINQVTSFARHDLREGIVELFNPIYRVVHGELLSIEDLDAKYYSINDGTYKAVITSKIESLIIDEINLIFNSDKFLISCNLNYRIIDNDHVGYGIEGNWIYGINEKVEKIDPTK